VSDENGDGIAERVVKPASTVEAAEDQAEREAAEARRALSDGAEEDAIAPHAVGLPTPDEILAVDAPALDAAAEAARAEAEEEAAATTTDELPTPEAILAATAVMEEEEEEAAAQVAGTAGHSAEHTAEHAASHGSAPAPGEDGLPESTPDPTADPAANPTANPTANGAKKTENVALPASRRDAKSSSN
jgi:hypothetical protein